MQVASARQDEFVFTGFLVCYWFWEKAITKKRMAILVKETKIKDVIIIINTRTRKCNFSPFNIFLLSEKTRTQKKKRWAGFNNNLDFDDCSHEHLELSMPETKHAYK